LKKRSRGYKENGREQLGGICATGYGCGVSSCEVWLFGLFFFILRTADKSWNELLPIDLNRADFVTFRGPEVESWFGVPEGSDPAAENEWSLLPFMALSDGAHA
jgi:hypothetical protein